MVDTTRLKVHGFFPAHYYGPIEIKVHVGNNASEGHSVTFSAATPQGVAVAAAAVFGGLALLFMGLVRRSISSYTRSGEKYGALAALFLDRQTDSYSLSKFQVLAWTAVTVYSYIYLFLCRTLIQGNFSTFPGVAQNLPQLFFVSAGTTVAAAAITSNWGSKGAGAPTPSMADFISTGGLVAGDRFQFFIWTVVGCMGYVYLVVRNDPARFTELPNVPDNFLYLMGVSSAGYLGGKLVRKPGPIIKVLSVTRVTSPEPGMPPLPPPPPTTMTVNLKGENLDPKATLKVDDQPLRGSLFEITDGGNTPPDPQTKFCSELEVTLKEADKYAEGTHQLTIVNTDGQAATVSFPIDPLSIDSVPEVTAGNDSVSVVVTGRNFVGKITAGWTDAQGNRSKLDPPDLQDPTKLTVRLKPGAQAGTGKLTLRSEIGLLASKEVTVRKA